ncbi:MAG TPA: cobalamin-independent methionine synthase II family protein [Dehalococcoidia bacterium]|nr:cobalamin-independent methionine synthase II family protein [Dehalococcoidia bacterium]
MRRSTDRILTTHVGSLPRPDDLRLMLIAKDEGQPYDAAALRARVRESVLEVVRRQRAAGIDIVNDGEQSKRSWSTYARERLGGHEQRPAPAGSGRAPIYGRDAREFPEYFELLGPGRGPNTRGGITSTGGMSRSDACVAPLTYIGQDALQADIDNLTAALKEEPAEEAFMSAVSPGTIEHWLRNEYYQSDEEYLYAIAEAMRVEYEAIVAAGFVLQIDDPDLADAWQMHPDMDVPAYRKYAQLRIEALNHALRNIPPDRVRLHVCWGSYHGPHKYDIEMRDIIDLVLMVRADGYAVEAANPRHAHDWRAWQDVRIPDGKVILPGVVGHASDFIEHPELVAESIERYARIFGRENVIASTDCGLGPRVGHPSIAWAKFEALAEGARLATARLWSR